MPFRGYFALNGIEFANSSRVVSHLGQGTPTDDSIFGGEPSGPCGLVIDPDDDGLAMLPATSVLSVTDDGLATLPNGSRLYDAGLAEVGDCWQPTALCGCVSLHVLYDDSWPGLQDYLADGVYRPELAPWYDITIPESTEFGGVWIMDVKGLGPLTVERQVTEMLGSGGTAGPNRDTSRKITFDTLLIACSNAGVEYGLQWLACQLRATKDTDDSVLRYFNAHPSGTAATADSLVRELHGVIYTGSVNVSQVQLGGSARNRQADVYRVQFDLTALNPYAYLPQIPLDVEWDEMSAEAISWAHAAECDIPINCNPMPVMFSATCPPEVVDVGTNTPPPVCGGCLPVCSIERYVYNVPTYDYPFRCSETAATVVITNQDPTNPLTVQAYWKLADDSDDCGDDQFPVQINGLPPGAALTLDGISGRFYAVYGPRTYRPVGIVGTPTGAPWIPPTIDRSLLWQFVVIAPTDAAFDVQMSLADKEA